jgi:DNA polymerase-3 subunit alpha
MKRLKPEHIEDVIALLALYRPGPLKSGMVDQFVECKHGRAEIAYPHPMLEPVLSMTYGVIVYQEQVMNAARVLAGYSLAEADLLRRAMGKKIAAEMQKQKSRFVEGAISNEVRKEIAESIFDLIDHFSGYGFNKAHSTSYGIITYQTAWLKTYHRAELMAAVMSWEQAKREQLTQYVYDCIQADIPVLPPDINESTDRFTVICLPEDKKAIRYGLSAIKGFGEAAYKDLWAERQQRGPFQDLEDFLRRKPKKVTKASVLALLHAGALDSFGISRKELFHRIEAQKDKKKITRNPLQPELISTESKPDSPHEEEEKTPLEWTTTAQLEREAERLGFWVTGHPLDRYHDVEVRFRTATTLEVESLIRGTPVNLVGILTKIHRIQTRHGDLMTFLTIADRIGMTEVVLFPEVYERHKKKIQVGAPLLVSGVPEASEGQGKIQVQDLTDLPTLRAQIATTLHLYLTREETERSFLSSLLDLFAEYRGTCPVQIAVQETGQESPLGWCEDLGYKVVPTQELFDEIERRTGRPDALRIPSTPHKRR